MLISGIETIISGDIPMSTRVNAAADSFESLTRQLDDFMSDLTRRTFYRFSRSVGWQPAINLYEDEDHYYLCAELAGLAKDQIGVDVLGNKITVRGERAAPPPPERRLGGSCILRMEINSGPFERCIELPSTADMSSVAAKLTDGFLWITVAKRMP